MIKITKFFYINAFVFPLFIISYLTGSIHTLLISYCIVAVHEMSHLFASLLLHVRVKSIIVMPFGMTLRLSDSLIKSPEKEAVIAFCGPLSNFFMALCGFLFCLLRGEMTSSAGFFITLNLIIGALNLLPALPLDGGRILRALLVEKTGFLGAVSVTKKITRAVSIIIIIFGCYVLFISRMNISLVMVGAFLLISMISDGKNNEYIIMKDILYSGDKLKKNEYMKTRLIVAGEEVRLSELLKKFNYSTFHVIGVIDEKNQIKKLLTECEIVDTIVKKNVASTLTDV